MKEWIITNGLGGYASSTDLGGMNTRRYHGLLIAPLNPPRQRTLILSKVDESIEINSKKYDLFTNNVNGKIYDGYKYQTSFEKDIFPVYTYNVNGVVIEKIICMIHGKNAVVVYYRISNKKAKTKFNITPIMNFRDFHSEKHNTSFKCKRKFYDDKFQITFDEKYKVNVMVKNSKFEKHDNDYFKGMQYEKERERGFDYTENHLVPGTFCVDIKPNEDKEITFICSLEKNGFKLDELNKINAMETIKQEVKRINEEINNSKLLENLEKINSNEEENISQDDKNKRNLDEQADLNFANKKEINEEKQYLDSKPDQELKILDLNNNNKIDHEDREIYHDLVKRYIISSDNFIVYRKHRKLHTIIAGYPWFLDWGRDTFIAFEGILLIPRRFELAKEVLLTFALKEKEGLIPNGFSEYDGKPLYNSADSSLLFIDAVQKYLNYTNDYEFVKDKLYNTMKKIINKYIDGINIDNNNIYLDDKDYLLICGNDNTQNTWMDAKVNGKAITPRNGKAVEINAMWYNALKIMQDISIKLKKHLHNIEYSYIAKKCKASFEEKFYNMDKKCLYDVIKIEQKQFSVTDTEKDDKIRPNQIFSISMEYPIIDCNSDTAKNIFITVSRKLYNRFGLRTLAPDEIGYAGIYEGNPIQRDSIYHQGTSWPWLLGQYYNAMKNILMAEQDEEEKNNLQIILNEFRIKTAYTFINEIYNGNTQNGICELYDGDITEKSHGKGAFQQAWSIAEVYRIIFGK